MKLPRWAAALWSRWPHVVTLVVGVAVLRGAYDWPWSWILALLAGILALLAGLLVFKSEVEGLAAGVLNRHWERWVTPGFSGQRSIVFPRVWTLHIHLYTPAMEKWFSPHPPESDSASVFWGLGATSAFLRELKIEEYTTRIRVHRWLVSTRKGHGEAFEERYDWTDLAHVAVRCDHDSSPREDHKIWSYSRDNGQLRALLHLSVVWRNDKEKKRLFLEVTLWLEHPPTTAQDYEGPIETLFSIRLDPALLDDERGEPVYVGGEPVKAGSVVPYPLDEENWEGGGVASGWSWHLWMQTFDKGSVY